MTSGESSTEPLELALHDRHQELGAHFVEERGTAVPGDYGDPGGELEALRERFVVHDLSWQGRLELRGRDRQRFLNGLVTSNVRDLPPGAGVYGFLTSKQGRVLADVYVTALADRLWLELPAGSAAEVRRHLEGYRVVDDVEVAPLDDLATLAVLGPGAAAALGGSAAELAPDATLRTSVSGCEVQLVRRRVLGVDGLVLWAPSSLAGEILTDLVAAGGRAAGLLALEARRVELGVGRWGVDFDADAVANETGLVPAAVDFSKGCYLGQEIVARIHYRGRPATECVALAVEGRPQRPDLPADLLAPDGEPAGTLTSLTPGPVAGSWLAIGRVSRRALDQGGALALRGGGVVTTRAVGG